MAVPVVHGHNGCTLLRVQYVMGHYEGAVTTLERSLHTVRTAFEEAEDYLITVKHRYVGVYWVENTSQVCSTRGNGLWVLCVCSY